MKFELKPVKIKDKGDVLWRGNDGKAEIGRAAIITYKAYNGGITMKFHCFDESLNNIKKRVKSRKVYVVFEEVEK